MENSNDIHTLWIGEHLSAMELLTLKSFLFHGFKVNLWTYADIVNIPAGVQLKNATEILPETSIFSYNKPNKFGHGKGSFSGFSDVFRYKLLYEKGGIWIDMDISCLQPFAFDTNYFFRYHHKIGLVGNVLKAPKGAPLMKWCYEQCIKVVNAENTNWLLPIELLKEGVYRFNLESYIQDISNPDSFPLVRELYFHSNTDISQCSVIHWMNEEFRRMNIDKNYAIKHSHYQYLLSKYNIPFTFASRKQVNTLKWKTSTIYYALTNLKARYNWYLSKLRSNF